MKKIVFLLFVVLFVGSTAFGAKRKKSGRSVKRPKKQVLMVIAPVNFRDEEFFVTKKMLEKKGISVVVASKSKSEAIGMLGGKFTPQLAISELKKRALKNFDAIILVGGSGSRIYYDDLQLRKIIKSAIKYKKVVAAICLAPGILAKGGFLKGMKATIWSGAKDVITDNGGIYTDSPVVVDKFITADGPTHVTQFAKAILSALGEK